MTYVFYFIRTYLYVSLCRVSIKLTAFYETSDERHSSDGSDLQLYWTIGSTDIRRI